MSLFDTQYISYEATNTFSKLVTDYIDNTNLLDEFISNKCTIEAIGEAIATKKNNYSHRYTLVEVLKNQYAQNNITYHQVLDTLADENTFTICTAHQPIIFTGPLYFIYKIIHTIVIARECSIAYPSYKFIPVYYIGSEDHDIEEIGKVQVDNNTYQWQPDNAGACGRISTSSLQAIVTEIKKHLNIAIDDENKLYQLFATSYNEKNTLAQATLQIVHALFHTYNVVALDADNKELKTLFTPIIKNELLQQNSIDIVSNQVLSLQQKGYTAQAYVRAINLFYITNNNRSRIIFEKDVWQTADNTASFTREEILTELENFPERFSPNVILRPLYQETILPNVCFVGGGGELSYWLQLKNLFDAHNIVFPLIQLRNSILIIPKKIRVKIEKLQLSNTQLFYTSHILQNLLIENHPSLIAWEKVSNETISKYNEYSTQSSSIAVPLQQSIDAHIAKIKKNHAKILEKTKKHIKRKNEVEIQALDVIKTTLFPKEHLQERHDNIISLVKQYGISIIETLVQEQKAFENKFMLLLEN